MKKLSLFLILLFSKSFAEEITLPETLLKEERHTFPYVNLAFGSFAAGVQAGVMHREKNHGFDLRLGAGSLLFVSGANAQANYLWFPQKKPNESTYFGCGIGGGFLYEFMFDADHTHGFIGPNLSWGKMYITPKGKRRVFDISVLIPVDQKKGYRILPTVSGGWMF